MVCALPKIRRLMPAVLHIWRSLGLSFIFLPLRDSQREHVSRWTLCHRFKLLFIHISIGSRSRINIKMDAGSGSVSKSKAGRCVGSQWNQGGSSWSLGGSQWKLGGSLGRFPDPYLHQSISRIWIWIRIKVKSRIRIYFMSICNTALFLCRRAHKKTESAKNKYFQ